MFFKVQLHLRGIELSESKRSKVQRKLKKACTTRWLSFSNAVDAYHADYVAVSITLSSLAEKDPKARGMLMEFKTAKFWGAVYILKAILPHLATLSKTLQTGSIHYSHVQPAVERTLR